MRSMGEDANRRPPPLAPTPPPGGASMTERRAQTAMARYPPLGGVAGEQPARPGTSMSSRTPTPQALRRESRTPRCSVFGFGNALSSLVSTRASTALDQYPRTGSAMDYRSPTPGALTMPPLSARGTARSHSLSGQQDREDPRLLPALSARGASPVFNEAPRDRPELEQALMPRPKTPADEGDDLLLSDFAGQWPQVPRPLALTAPPSGRVSLAPLATRGPLGGVPRRPRKPTSEPAKMAAPVARPHNSWCTFVEWVPPADGSEDPEFGYEVNCESDRSKHCLLLTDIGREPRAQFNGLEEGCTYYFQVRGRNECGTGPWSDWSQGYTVPIQEEAPRTALERAFGSTRPRRQPRTHSEHPHCAVLEWDEPCSHGSQILGYRVQYGLNPENPDTIETETILNRLTQLTISKLLPNSVYYFRVCALNEVGVSDWTEWSAGVATKAVAPEAPKRPTMAQATDREIVIQWEPPFSCGFPVSRYDVRVSTGDPSMQSAVLHKGVASRVAECFAKVKGLEPYTCYYVQVRGESAMGLSPWSEVGGPMQTKGTAPDACECLRVIKNEVKNVSLEWIAPSSHGRPITSFVVRWADNEFMSPELGRVEVPGDAKTQRGAKILCQISNVQPGACLFFDCAAQSDAGLGPFCRRTNQIVAAPDCPSRPDPPLVEVRTSMSMLVYLYDTVADNGGAITHYELRWDYSASFTRGVLCPGKMRVVRGGHGEPNRHEYAVTGLNRRGPYFFSVRAYNDAGPSEWSMASSAQLLHCDVPATMSAPLLTEALSSTALLIEYTPPANLGASMGGGLLQYELRFSRSADAFTYDEEEPTLGFPGIPSARHAGAPPALPPSPGRAAGAGGPTTTPGSPTAGSASKVRTMRWMSQGHGVPDPVKVTGLLTGRTYVFQIRAVSDFGAGPWSDTSAPFETLPSPPCKPPPITLAPGEGNPFSANLRLVLPESNGKPVTKCRLKFLGPNWATSKTRPRVTEWKDLGQPPLNFVEAEDCDVASVAWEGSSEESATQARRTVWHYTVVPLEPGAEYRFIFCCSNCVGESEWSDDGGPIVTLPSVPDQCEPLFLENEEEDRTADSLRLVWKPPHDNGSAITHYTIHWAANARFQSHRVVEVVKEAEYTFADLAPNQWYFFKVSAWNAVGQGKFSEMEPAKSQSGGRGAYSTMARVPGPPREVIAEAIDKMPGAALICWNKPLDDGGSTVTRYKIAYSLTPGFEVYSEVVQKAFRECKVTDLKPDQVYYFDVSAANSVGYGERTGDPAVVKTNPVPPQRFIAPCRPAKPKVEVVPGEHWSESALKVAWACPEAYDLRRGFLYDPQKQTHMILHYTVQIRGGFPKPELIEEVRDQEFMIQARDKRTVPRDNTNVATFSRVLPGRYYFALVQAFSEAGASGWSIASEIVRTPAGVPNAVSTMQVATRTLTSLTLQWPCPTGNGEEVFRFLFRLREDRVLRGWAGGSPPAPGEGGPTDGQYEEVGGWLEAVDVPFGDCEVSGEAVPGSPAATGYGSEGRICRHWLGDLQPASFYSLEVIAENVIGRSPLFVSDSFRSASTTPGPTSRVQGDPSKATLHDVVFSWRAPTYQGGEAIEAYEVRWAVLAYKGALPQDIEEITAEGKHTERKEVGPDDLTYVARGLRPGDYAVPVVRARTCEGYGPWCRLPGEADLQALSTVAAPPAVTEVAPIIERAASNDHRPYSWTARWITPPLHGSEITHFTLRFDVAQVQEGESTFGATQHEVKVKAGPEPYREGEEVCLQFANEGLLPGVAYVLRVRASNSVGDSEAWGPGSEPDVAPPDCPETPQPPWSQWQWPDAIEVLWREPWMKGAPLLSCELRYARSPDMYNPVLVDEAAANKNLKKKEIMVEGLEAATTLYFQIRARNSVGWSLWSDASEGFATCACRPAAPERPALKSICWHSLTVCWLPPSDHGAAIEEYIVVLVPRAEGLGEILEAFDSRSEEVIETAAREGQSQTETGKKEDLKRLLKEPSVKARVAKALEDADAALLEVVKPQEVAILQAAELSPSAPSHVFPNLLGGLDFSLAVRARNAEGVSDWSQVLENVRTPTSPPLAPPPLILLEASQTTLTCEFRLPFDNGEPITCMELSWTRVVGPVDRHLALGGKLAPGREPSRETQGAVVSVLPDPGPAKAPPYGYGGAGQDTIPGLEPGTEYDVQVRAGNSSGYGPYSQKVRMVCGPGRPDMPFSVRHANKTSAALPPPPEVGPAILDVSLGILEEDEQESPPEDLEGRPISPTVFFSHTGRLRETEAISAAAGDRPVQRKIFPFLDPGTPQE